MGCFSLCAVLLWFFQLAIFLTNGITTIKKNKYPISLTIDIDVNYYFMQGSNNTIDGNNTGVNVNATTNETMSMNITAQDLSTIQTILESLILDINIKDSNAFGIVQLVVENDEYLEQFLVQIVIETEITKDAKTFQNYFDSALFKTEFQDEMELDFADIVISSMDVITDLKKSNSKATLTELNWLQPLRYSLVQYLISGGVLFLIVICVVGCIIYICCVCKKREKDNHEKVRQMTSDDVAYTSRGMRASIHQREQVELGTSVAFVD